VVVDDYIPYVDDKPLYISGNVCACLIEKAFATIMGSYKYLDGGNPALALEYLTGFPCDVADSLEVRTKAYALMCGYTKDDVTRLKPQHAYPIVGIDEDGIELIDV
jgi:hypothetical protein